MAGNGCANGLTSTVLVVAFSFWLALTLVVLLLAFESAISSLTEPLETWLASQDRRNCIRQTQVRTARCIPSYGGMFPKPVGA